VSVMLYTCQQPTVIQQTLLPRWHQPLDRENH
jgi:hypothetical protein